MSDIIFYTPPIQNAFEGASTSYRNGLRGLLVGEPDTLAVRELLNLQLRSSHALRNNGYAKTARDKYVTNLKALTVRWVDKKGKKHDLMQALWDEFIADPNLDGHGDFNTTQAIVNSSEFEYGATFIRKHIRRNGNKNKIPLKLEIIPTYLHDIGYMNNTLESNIKYGIQFEDSKPINYFFRQDVFDSLWNGKTNPLTPTKIPADELIHIFKRTTPGQWIGIPELASVLLPLYEIDDLVDATVAKQKAAQAIAWIIENTNPISMTPTGSPVVVKDKEQNDKVVFKAQGGSTQYLNKGESIKFYQSTDIGSNLPVLIEQELRKICSTVGVPYYQLTGDTTGLDFSSLRAIAIELRNRIEFIHHFYTIPLFLNPLTSYFKDLAVLYNSRVSNAFPIFEQPRWYGVDELKDAQADLLEVQNGMATLESKLAERHTTYEEIEADRKRIKEVGLDHLLDPTNAKAQMAQANNNQANTNSSSN